MVVLALLLAVFGGAVGFGYLQRWRQQKTARHNWFNSAEDGAENPQYSTAVNSPPPLVPAYLVASVAALLRSGMSLEPAWKAALIDAGHPQKDVTSILETPEFAGVAPSVKAAQQLAAELGVAVADTLDAIVGCLEEAAENFRLIEVAQAGPQATAKLLSFLPLLGLLVAWTLGADPVGFFTVNSFSWVIGVCGIGFWTAGKLWVKHLIRKVSLQPGNRVEPLVVVKLLEACLQAGLAVPRCLEVLGSTCGEPGLRTVAKLFLLGAKPVEIHAFIAGGATPVVAQLAQALLSAWMRGANPVATLDLVAQRLRKENTQLISVQTQKLGVWLALPLGLCYLPAFILLGVVPIGWGLFNG